MNILSILILIVGASSRQNFKWENNIIPYFFEDSVSTEDMDLIKSQLILIEENTCLQFSAKPKEDVPRHHLKIAVNQTQCNDDDGKMRLSGRVDEDDGAAVMTSSFTLTDGECGQNEYKVKGMILHMLFLAFGASYMHRRPDRDQYVQINTDCIPDKNLKAFEINTTTTWMAMSVPYTCDSLMHYRNDSGTKCSEDSCGWLCPTILPRPGNMDCDKIGSYEANDVDWLMLNMYHCPVDRTPATKGI
jgi:hypothetical protein